MNPIFFATFLCLGALVSGNPLIEDGQWRGEGLAESQDNGQWNNDGVQGAWNAPAAAWAAPQGSWAHGAAPLGPDGRVVDTPEVAAATAAHLAAANGGAAWAPAAAWGGPAPAAQWAAPQGSWAHGAAPLGHDGRVVDTPEVAHAKAAHQAAVSAAGRY